MTATWDKSVTGERVIVVRDEGKIVAYVSHIDFGWLAGIGEAINSLCCETCYDSTTRQVTV